MNADFGSRSRSRHETILFELCQNQEGTNDAIKHLKHRIKPDKRHLDVTGSRRSRLPDPKRSGDIQRH